MPDLQFAPPFHPASRPCAGTQDQGRWNVWKISSALPRALPWTPARGRGDENGKLGKSPYAFRTHTAVSWNTAPPIGGGLSAEVSRLMPTPSS